MKNVLRICTPVVMPILVLSLATAPLAAGTATHLTVLNGEVQRAETGDLPLAPLAIWSENFDSYATGSQLHGQGGWKGWDNSPAAGALTSSTQARSSANSANILAASDLVHEYAGHTSGLWTYTAYQYIPAAFSGMSYFILLNSYVDAGPYNWSVQVAFDTGTGTVFPDFGACMTGNPSLPLILDAWVEIRLLIDLDNNTQKFFYGNQELYTCSWSEGASGGGVVNIAAVDLYANNATSIFYDDMSLVELMFGDGFESEDTARWSLTSP